MGKPTAGDWCDLADEAAEDGGSGRDRVRVVGYVSREVSDGLDSYCEAEQRSRSSVVALALREFLAYRRRVFPQL